MNQPLIVLAMCLYFLGGVLMYSQSDEEGIDCLSAFFILVWPLAVIAVVVAVMASWINGRLSSGRE